MTKNLKNVVESLPKEGQEEFVRGLVYNRKPIPPFLHPLAKSMLKYHLERDSYSWTIQNMYELNIEGLAHLARELSMVDESLKFLEKRKYFSEAAQLAEEAGEDLRAINYHEKARHYYEAAELAEKHGLLERAFKNWKKAGLILNTARVAKRLGLEEESKKLYQKTIDDMLKAGSYETALKVSKEAGLPTEKITTLLDYIKEE